MEIILSEDWFSNLVVGNLRGRTKMPEQETRRHPESIAYCCFLSDLTRFTMFRRAGPTQAAKA